MEDNSGKKKAGRPRTWKPTLLDYNEIEVLAGKGLAQGDIAEVLGITRAAWRHSMTKFPQIELAYMAGKVAYQELMYKHMQSMAMDPDSRHHFAAVKWVLEVECGMGVAQKAVNKIADKFDRKTGKFTDQAKPYEGYNMVPAAPRTDKPDDSDEIKFEGPSDGPSA